MWKAQTWWNILWRYCSCSKYSFPVFHVVSSYSWLCEVTLFSDMLLTVGLYLAIEWQNDFSQSCFCHLSKTQNTLSLKSSIDKMCTVYVLNYKISPQSCNMISGYPIKDSIPPTPINLYVGLSLGLLSLVMVVALCLFLRRRFVTRFKCKCNFNGW